jgi:hypothetical protein
VVQALSQSGVGANGVAVTSSNCTNPNQFNTVAKTATAASITFDNAHTIHGNATAIKHHWSTTANTSICQWKAAITTATANSYASFYCFITALPSLTIRLASTATGAGSASTALLILNTGTIRIADALGSPIATTTAVAPLNAWFRVEYEVTGISGTTGTVTTRLYSGSGGDSVTADSGGTVTGSGAAVAGLMNDIRFGQSASTTLTSAWDIWYQDMAWSDTAQPGPVIRPRLPVRQSFAVTRAANY